MTEIDRAHPTPVLAAEPPRRRLSLALIVPWLLAAVLATSQVATLLSEKANDMAYSALATLFSLAGPTVADAVLARSPSSVKAQAVRATRQLQSEVADVRNRNRTLQADIEATKASKAALAREHDALKATTARRAAAVRAVSVRSATTLATRASDAIKTLPVRAAPYVGIAAAVSFTVLDLKADCDLALALAHLNQEHGNEPVDTGGICKAPDQVPSPQQAWVAIRDGSGNAWRATYAAIEGIATRAKLSLDAKKLP